MRSTRASAAGLFSATNTEPSDNPNIIYVVQDTNADMSQPRNWRHPGLIIETYEYDVSGLEKLWVSSSAAPNERHFQWIDNQINQITNRQAVTKVILDLREESHAYFNGQAYTHATEHNWVNRGKTKEQAQQTEQSWIESVARQEEINGVLNPDQHKAIASTSTNGVNIIVESAVDEKTVAEAAGFQYKRLFVSDHMAPRQPEIDDFLLFVSKLPENTWIHLHCRGGEGRSTTFLTMLDMLRNADKLPFETFIDRQASIPPYYRLSQMTRRCPELTIFYKARYEYIQNFYNFAKEYIKGNVITWAEWENRKPANEPIIARP